MFTEYHRESQEKQLVVGPGDNSYFGQITSQDIIEWCRPLFEQRGYHLRDSDGKIVFEGRMAWDTPWHHVKHAHGLDCHLWHQVMFDIVFTRMGQQKWVPSACHECWKVVVRPQTISGLMALLKLQIRLDRPSKCGIETRETVHGLYGGYFYNRSLDEGLDCYELVRNEVDNTPELGKDVGVILKRACTEFELRAGDATKWEVTPEQAHVEAVCNAVFTHDLIMRTQPEWAVTRVHTRWMQWAYQMGDSEVFKFTDGKVLFPPPVTYHQLLPERKKALKAMEDEAKKAAELAEKEAKPKKKEAKPKKKDKKE